MLGYKAPFEINALGLLDPSEIRTKYYFRLRVEDKVGVLAKITNLMSENNLSIDSLLQKPKDESPYATLFFTTHTSVEKDVRRTMEILQEQEFVKEKPFMMRIEE